MTRKKVSLMALMSGFTVYFYLASTANVYAMHIMEGFLPLKWVIFWWLLSLPFLILGMRSITKKVSKNQELKSLLGLSTAFAFVLSAFKLPSVTGSSSHATGVGLGTLLFGPVVMTVVGFIVLIFQSLLLAHGGISTLGANTFSMAIVGPFVTYGIFLTLKKVSVNFKVTVFLAAAIGNLATYTVTSLQLALAFPDPVSGIVGSFIKFISVFGLTQVPLALTEGVLTVIALTFVYKYSSNEFDKLGIRLEEVR